MAKIFPDFKGLDNRKVKKIQIQNHLQRAIESLRGGKIDRFYTAREIADFFQVTHALVLQVFSNLEKEGVLLRQRSSGTLLMPVKSCPRRTIHGLVGIPLWHMGYCHDSDWRKFCMNLEIELQKRHYIANFIFFGSEEIENPDFTGRLLRYQMDWLIWFLPIPSEKMILQSLHDSGTHIITVPESEISMPFASYPVSYENGVAGALMAWINAGIRKVTVLASQDHNPHIMEKSIRALEKFRLPHQIHHSSPDSIQDFLDSAPASQEHAVFIPHPEFSKHLSKTLSSQFLELIRKHRVLVKGYLECDYSQAANARLDMVVADWPVIAQKITNALVTGSALRQESPETCQANLHLQISPATFPPFY
ncbi:hypothetical protein QPK87_30150 [Kamptonema cortianum]|nr:hypothetical protein [Kamptonema cortianum]